MISKLLAGLAASALVAAPVAATAAPAATAPAASKLSLTQARAGAPVGKASKAAAGTWVPAVLAAANVICGIVLVVDDDDDSDSN